MKDQKYVSIGNSMNVITKLKYDYTFTVGCMNVGNKQVFTATFYDSKNKYTTKSTSFDYALHTAVSKAYDND